MPGGRRLENRLRSGRDLCQRRRDVDVLSEENLDDAVTGQRLRLNVLNVGDLRGQIPFVEIDDAAGHIVRQEAVVGPDDADHGNVDVRENVGRSTKRSRCAKQRNYDRKHNECVRSPKRDLNDPHGGPLLCEPQLVTAMKSMLNTVGTRNSVDWSRWPLGYAVPQAHRAKARVRPDFTN